MRLPSWEMGFGRQTRDWNDRPDACTAAVLVMMAGALVVGDHLSGRLRMDDELLVTMLALPAAR